MAILPIILEGNPRLRQKATKIRRVDDSLRKLAADMHETMVDAPGVGLAAPQVAITLRLIVVNVPENYDQEGDPAIILTLVNPEIVKAVGRVVGTEGCLSIPGWIGDVPRSETITIKAMDLDNRAVRLKLRGYSARVVQHEIDHLDGILFVDRIEDRLTLRHVPESTELTDDDGDPEVVVA